jgi:hypothetical protein
MKNKMILRKILIGTAAFILFLPVRPSLAVIFSGTSFNLDFTKRAELSKKANWGSESKSVSLSQDGLTLQAPQNTSADVWVQVTEPIAVGFSWRTVSSVNIEAEVAPPGKFVFRSDTIQFPSGTLYGRYSADALHWSDWQYIKMDQPKDQNEPKQKYSGTLGVPAFQRQKYGELLMQYQKMDVPWKNDEEAAVEWIVKNDPNFFENSAPFVGYVQFRFEISLKGGQYIKTINFDIKYSVGGLFTLPKGQKLESIKLNTPWRYKAPSLPEIGTIQSRTRSIEAAIEAYYLNCGVYPKTLDDLLVCPAGLEDKWAGPYIKQSQLYDANGKMYFYTSDGKIIENAKQ